MSLLGGMVGFSFGGPIGCFNWFNDWTGKWFPAGYCSTNKLIINYSYSKRFTFLVIQENADPSRMCLAMTMIKYKKFL